VSGGRIRFGGTRLGWAWVVLVGVAAASAAPASAQDMGPWAKGRQWISVRAGYARSAAEGAADGNVGFGFGYIRFRNSKWSLGAQAAVDILGRYGDAYELEAPWTVEVARHYQWPTTTRPYVGAGGGVFYNKLQGTGDDRARLLPGFYLMTGTNTIVSPHGLLGFDVRASLVKVNSPLNPVFGGEATTGQSQSRAIHWSAKVTYAWAF
jgi:hypothetical protein